MKATDLRINNYFHYHIVDPMDERGEWDELSQIDYDDLRIFTQFEDNSEYRPIPLNEEWLRKFGFEKVGTNYQKGWLLLHGNNKTDTIDFLLNEPYSGKFNATVLLYVHQLQNLYFALTCEELILKTK